MKKILFLIITLTSFIYAYDPCGARFGAGNSEAYFENEGYHECGSVRIIDYNIRGNEVVVKIKNYSNEEKVGYVLAGFIDSVTHRIGWACGYDGFDLEPHEKEVIDVQLEATPIFSHTYDAKVYCK